MRSFIFAILINIMFIGYAKEHIVVRGESLESIAASYGLTLDQLIEANPTSLSLFYIGLKLEIPEVGSSKDSPIMVDNSDLETQSSKTGSTFSASISSQLEAIKYDIEAEEEFDKKNYKKAAKLYGKALKIEPSAHLYFNRGLSYYNAKKYNDAIRDFQASLKYDPDDEIKDRIPGLIESAEKLQIQRMQKRGQLLAAIFGATLGVTQVALQASQIKSSRKVQSSNVYGGMATDYSSTGYSSSSSGYSSSSTSSTSSNTSSGKDCSICRGTGKCQTCNGKGTYITSFGDDVVCSNCSQGGRSNGRCPWCKGTGKK